MKYAPALVKMKILSFVDQNPQPIIKDRILAAANTAFVDDATGEQYRFTWRTISTWYYRYKKHGTESLLQKSRKDKGTHRKISPEELAELIVTAEKHLPKTINKNARKTVIYHWLLENQYLTRSQLSPTTYYRFIRTYHLMEVKSCKKLRLSWSMPYANDLWQGDTQHGPMVKDMKGTLRKTYMIALIDDCSKLVTHAAFYHQERIPQLTHAMKMAIYCRGIPKMLYFDNGSIYKSKTIIDACVRLNIHLSHAPVRDGSAKGKIERFNRFIKWSFYNRYGEFKNIDHLNKLFKEWLYRYNNRVHSTIQMTPENKFSLDIKKVRYLENSEFNDEIFYTEALRCVTKTNTFSLNGRVYECPVDMRERKAEVRFDPLKPNRVIVYYNQKRVGVADFVNLNLNAKLKRESRFK